MIAVWDGIIRPETLRDWAAAPRRTLADAAHAYDWERVLILLEQHPELVNSARLGGTSWYAPLHQAAHGGAPSEVVDRLIDRGAWRTLQNARGERPLDVAGRRGHVHLLDILQPEYRRQVPLGILLKIQTHLHALIRSRVGALVDEHSLRLPELEPLLELPEPEMGFTVPGMYGGYHLRLVAAGVDARLKVSGVSRVWNESGEHHEITSAGAQPIDSWIA